MTGRDIIEFIQNNHLYDYKLQVAIAKYGFESFSLNLHHDIGYADKIVKFGVDE